MYSRPSHSIYNIKISQSHRLSHDKNEQIKKKLILKPYIIRYEKQPTTTNKIAAKIKAKQEKSFTFAKCLQTNPIQRQVFFRYLQII